MTANAILAMTSTASSGVLMLTVTLLAALKISSAEQGYFFTFLSFGALIQLADFGLSYAAMQTASHIHGPTKGSALLRLASKVFRWNMVVTMGASVAVGLIGGTLFAARAGTDEALAIEWMAPWLLFVGGTCLAQMAAPSVALREGAGRIREVWRLRLYSEWAAGFVCLLALYLGAGLWSLSLMCGMRALCASTWLRRQGRLSDLPPAQESEATNPLPDDIWSFQWRIGLSGLAGFLIFRIFSPIVMLEQGPVPAGQFGIAIAMMNMLLAMTTAWPMSQAARYGMLVASGRFDEIRTDHSRLMAASTALSLLLAAGLSAAFWAIETIGLPFAQRVTDPATTALILTAAVAHHVVACFAMPLRAERREPFLIVSIVGGIATAVAIWFAARYGTARDIAWANLFLAALGIPVAYFLFKSRSRHWPSS